MVNQSKQGNLEHERTKEKEAYAQDLLARHHVFIIKKNLCSSFTLKARSKHGGNTRCLIDDKDSRSRLWHLMIQVDF